MSKRNLIAILVISLVFAVNIFGQNKDVSKVARYSPVRLEKADSAKSTILNSTPLKADVKKNPQLANQIYDVTAKVMAMNKAGKLQYVQYSTQCLMDKKIIGKAEKTKVDSLLSYMLDKDTVNAKKVLDQLKNSDNIFIKTLVGSLSNPNNQGGVDVQSGSEVGEAIGTIAGALAGGYFGGLEGAAEGAAVGGTVGKALGSFWDALTGGGKGNEDNGEDTGDDEGDDTGDEGGSGGGATERRKPSTPKKWITVDTSKWKCATAPY